jgi:hypothetical protein
MLEENRIHGKAFMGRAEKQPRFWPLEVGSFDEPGIGGKKR